MGRLWPQPPSGFVSVNEARARLGVGRTLIYSWISTGALPSRRWGDRRIIAIDDLEILAASERRPSQRSKAAS